MTVRPASLGMYDGETLTAANDRLWSAIAQRLRTAGVEAVPDGLDRGRPLEAIWDDPELLLAQSCGYPWMTRWRDRLRYVATPRYRAAGCEGALHRSRIIVRADDPVEKLADYRGRRAAINQWHSNSGMNLLRATVAPVAQGAPFFAAVIETGSHAASMAAVASGEADIAAIDAVTFALHQRDAPELTERLRTLAWSIAVPGLPLVTAAATTRHELAALRGAVRAIAESPALADARERLLIDGFELLPKSRYDAILRAEQDAAKRGYALLR